MSDNEKHTIETREKASEDGSIKKVHIEDEFDFGGERSLPPPPTLTAEEEHKLYRKIDTRCVFSLSSK